LPFNLVARLKILFPDFHTLRRSFYSNPRNCLILCKALHLAPGFFFLTCFLEVPQPPQKPFFPPYGSPYLDSHLQPPFSKTTLSPSSHGKWFVRPVLLIFPPVSRRLCAFFQYRFFSLRGPFSRRTTFYRSLPPDSPFGRRLPPTPLMITSLIRIFC